MRANPVDLIGGYYADDTLPWSCQDTVNWLPVMAEVGGTRTPSKLATPPGLKPYQRVGTGPIRGMHDLEGAQFVVSGRYLYRIGTSGVAVPIGVIPGVGRVSMTHNQFKTGYQLLVENGQGGGGYVYDSNTKAFARITDEGYPGSISSDYLDSYLLGVEPQGRYWFHSNLADATDYNTLDRYESEASPDKIVGLAVSQLEVVVFNQRTIEFFYNAGGATGTFQNRRQSITRGCASRHTIAKLDNTLFWLGDDGIVYRLEGYSARPISTGPMHRAFAGKNWSEAFAQVWEDRGFKVYYLTFPDGMTFGYDVVSGLWTRRQSFGLNRWRLSHIVRWGTKWYGGDYQDGRNWELDWSYQLEGDQPIISERVSPDLADDQSELIIPNAELIFDTGQGPETSPVMFPVQPAGPTISGDAPDAVNGTAYPGYSYAIAVGDSPISSVAVVSGALPDGLSLSAAGVISQDLPTKMGTFKFVVRVTDTKGLWSEISDSIMISAASYATVVSSANAKIRVTRLAYDWSGLSGDLPFRPSGSIVTAYGSKLHVIGTTGSAVSTDGGVTWQLCTGIPSVSFVAVLYCDGQWIAVPTNGTSLYKSADGVAFTQQTYTSIVNPTFPACIAFDKVAIITKGDSTGGARSTDGGATWVSGGISSSNSCFAIDRNPTSGVLLATAPRFGVPRIAKSVNNGQSWVYLDSPAGRTELISIRYGAGMWLLITQSPYECWRSRDDGASWTKVTSPGGSWGAIGDFNEFVFDGQNFILASSSFIQTTVNGDAWVTRTSISASTLAVRN